MDELAHKRCSKSQLRLPLGIGAFQLPAQKVQWTRHFYLWFLDQIEPDVFRSLLSDVSLRSTDKRTPFQLQTGNKYRKGRNVLIDCLLLSRWDFLLKCSSHVGEAVLWFNPEPQSIDMNYKRLERR